MHGEGRCDIFGKILAGLHLSGTGKDLVVYLGKVFAVHMDNNGKI